MFFSKRKTNRKQKAARFQNEKQKRKPTRRNATKGNATRHGAKPRNTNQNDVNRTRNETTRRDTERTEPRKHEATRCEPSIERRTAENKVNMRTTRPSGICHPDPTRSGI